MSVLYIERVLYGDGVGHITVSDSYIESRIGEAIVVDFVPFLSLPIVERDISELFVRIASADT